MFAVLALWLLFVETGADLGDYTTLLNYRMLAFASGIASLYLAALFVWRSRSEVDIVDAAHVVGGLVLAANFLTLWILSAEVIATVDDVVVDADEDTVFYTKSLALSLVWAVYASVGLVLGVVKRWKILRLASLGLLALPIVKLFLFDSFALDQGFRVAAFLSLGGLLLGGGLLYQRYGEAIRGFLFEERAEESPQTAPTPSSPQMAGRVDRRSPNERLSAGAGRPLYNRHSRAGGNLGVGFPARKSTHLHGILSTAMGVTQRSPGRRRGYSGRSIVSPVCDERATASVNSM